MAEPRILVGVFGAPHGVRGEVRLKSFTGDPAAIGSYGPLSTEDGRRFEIARLRHIRDDMFVAVVRGVASREAAAALTNVQLSVPREKLAPPDEEEFFHADLVGLRVEAAGVPVGVVAAVLNFGAGDILEIAVEGARDTLLLPFTKAVAPVVDLKAGRIAVVMPELVEGDAPSPPTGEDPRSGDET